MHRNIILNYLYASNANNKEEKISFFNRIVFLWNNLSPIIRLLSSSPIFTTLVN
jgi:hypothetical protein